MKAQRNIKQLFLVITIGKPETTATDFFQQISTNTRYLFYLFTKNYL